MLAQEHAVGDSPVRLQQSPPRTDILVYFGRGVRGQGPEGSSTVGSKTADLAGAPPPDAPWGTEQVLCSPDLARRLEVLSPRRKELCIVFGAAGALGPDIVHALRRRVAAVVGVDKQLTYWVDGVTYRQLDLTDPAAVRDFFRSVRAYAKERGLTLGVVYDLATIQTSATDGADRSALVEGKKAILDALCQSEGDAALVYMSTAEVYGVPAGAPYDEDHEKAPINVYGRHKHREEQAIMAAHGRETAAGRLRVVALRTWTISMVSHDADGQVVSARNYNDPMIALAMRLARSGVQLPVPGPALMAQFHRSEEVAEVLVRLGEQSPDRQTWGQALNCVGRPTTHGQMRDICFEVFAAAAPSAWARVVGPSIGVVAPVFAGAVRLGARWAHRSAWLGATRFGERLPFLYRSTHIDSARLQEALAGELSAPEGTGSDEAVRVLCEGLRRGGPGALSMRRYTMY